MSDRQWLSRNLVLPHARKKACLRGLDFIFGLAMQTSNFDAFGEDALQCFLETASVTGDPIRRRVLLYVEALGHRLRQETRRRGWVHGLYPTPMEVMDAIVSSHCLERMGLVADYKLELVAFICGESSGVLGGGKSATPAAIPPPVVCSGTQWVEPGGNSSVLPAGAAKQLEPVTPASVAPAPEATDSTMALDLPESRAPEQGSTGEPGPQPPKRRAARLASRKGPVDGAGEPPSALLPQSSPQRPRGLPVFRRPTRLSKERWDDPLLADDGEAPTASGAAAAAVPQPQPLPLDNAAATTATAADSASAAAATALPPEPAPDAAPAEAPPSAPARPAGASGMYIHTRPVAWGASDYLGWDATAGPPPTGYVQPELCTGCGMPNARRVETCAACGGPIVLLSPWRLLSNALVASYYAEWFGHGTGLAPLGGARYADVLQWLPRFRPYRAPAALPWDSFVDQAYLVTHVVLTLSNYGTLRLHPAALPHEFFCLREHLPLHMRQGDVHLVGEAVECLRVFGCDEADPLVRAALEWLLARQGTDGSWDHARTPDGRTRDAYTTYHATMTAVQALMVHAHRGWGPGIPAARALVEEWIAGGHGVLPLPDVAATCVGLQGPSSAPSVLLRTRDSTRTHLGRRRWFCAAGSLSSVEL